jgi:hypothetical protein
VNECNTRGEIGANTWIPLQAEDSATGKVETPLVSYSSMVRCCAYVLTLNERSRMVRFTLCNLYSRYHPMLTFVWLAEKQKNLNSILCASTFILDSVCLATDYTRRLVPRQTCHSTAGLRPEQWYSMLMKPQMLWVERVTLTITPIYP